MGLFEPFMFQFLPGVGLPVQIFYAWSLSNSKVTDFWPLPLEHYLALNGMGGGGAWRFSSTVQKRFALKNWNFLKFSINLWVIVCGSFINTI